MIISFPYSTARKSMIQAGISLEGYNLGGDLYLFGKDPSDNGGKHSINEIENSIRVVVLPEANGPDF